MKRWIAALLCVLLLLSVSGTAFAAEPETSETIKISSADDLLELAVRCTSDA